MKTAVSLPDEIFEETDKLARRLRKSRSQVYQEALREYLARHSGEAVTEAMNEVCDAIDTRADSFVEEASRRVLEKSEW